MDAALLLVAANEPCPAPQTVEHLCASECFGLQNVVCVQNKLVRAAATAEPTPRPSLATPGPVPRTTRTAARRHRPRPMSERGGLRVRMAELPRPHARHRIL